MSQRVFVGIGVSCMCLFSLAASLQAGGEKNGQKEFQLPEVSKPGKEHRVLRQMVGTFKVQGKMFTGPDNPPMAFEGTMKRRMIMGGRYLVENYSGDFFGKKFQGMGIAGYDRAKKKYFSIWIDSMSTSYMTSEGDFDPKTKTLTTVGVGYDPELKKDVKMKSLIRLVGKGREHMEMNRINADGSAVKMMEMVSTRIPGKKKQKKQG